MILVLGATGTNGREVVRRLLAAGQNVRAMVRDPSKAADLASQKLELVEGDLEMPASLSVVLRGVRKAFFVSAVNERYPRHFTTFLQAALGSDAPHIVKLSGMGADIASRSELMRQHGQTDRDLASSGLPFTILRPNSFYQNLLFSAASIKEQGEFYLPLGDARQSLVDVRDIADVATAALTAPGHEGKVYELTGPESLSYSDVASKLSSTLGRQVRYVDVLAEAAHDSMRRSGMPPWNARAVAELYTLFAAGEAARQTGTVSELLGRPPISFDEFARDYAPAFS
jgi:uncharacterized protein YbjT (DUF2867 family)